MLTAPWLCANMESARRQEYVAVGVGSFARSFLLFLFLPVLINSQLDHCLWPTGCHQDECCFNVVPKTGPICDRIPGCAASFDRDCCRNARPVYTDYGIMYGYAILLDDPLGYRSDGRKYLEIWRGVPYARPPTRENNLRFRKPVPPTQSSAKYDATYFRPSCAQPHLTSEDPFTVWSGSAYEWWRRISMRQTVQEAASISEDCLYLNIYVINETDSGPGSLVPGLRRKLPIVVFFDGLDHLVGSGNGYPGHVLAQLGLVVIFVNYRLGPFGYLATQSGTTQSTDLSESDDVALGNYGLWDQVRALEFIRENAEKFFGDPDKITLVGHGSAAGDVALHLLSKHSGRRNPPLFHRVILMSGSDQMEGGFVKHPDESLIYAKELAHQVGCDVSSERTMLACLRGRTTEELQTAGGYVRIHRPVWLTKPWSPQVDGDFIEDRPENLWAAGKFAHIPLIGGLTVDDGAFYALSSIFQLYNTTEQHVVGPMFIHNLFEKLEPNRNFSGISEELLKMAYTEMARRDFASDPLAIGDSLMFEYTDWANKSDDHKRWAMYREAWTDRSVGAGLILTLRYHSNGVNYSTGTPENRTQMYVFAYKSQADPWARILGSYGGSELHYLFGYPRLTHLKTAETLNSEWPDHLGLQPPLTNYTQTDRNMSDYLLFFLSNFAKSGNATPNAVRNLTWDTYRPDNRTYFWLNLTSGYNESRSHQIELEALGLGAGFDLRQNYRVYRYAFWNRLYPLQLTWAPRFTPPMPTPGYVIDYETASSSLGGICALLCVITLILFILYYRKRRLLVH